jgi:hypothetical protein
MTRCEDIEEEYDDIEFDQYGSVLIFLLKT